VRGNQTGKGPQPRYCTDGGLVGGWGRRRNLLVKVHPYRRMTTPTHPVACLNLAGSSLPARNETGYSVVRVPPLPLSLIPGDSDSSFWLRHALEHMSPYSDVDSLSQSRRVRDNHYASTHPLQKKTVAQGATFYQRSDCLASLCLPNEGECTAGRQQCIRLCPHPER